MHLNDCFDLIWYHNQPIIPKSWMVDLKCEEIYLNIEPLLTVCRPWGQAWIVPKAESGVETYFQKQWVTLYLKWEIRGGQLNQDGCGVPSPASASPPQTPSAPAVGSRHIMLHPARKSIVSWLTKPVHESLMAQKVRNRRCSDLDPWYFAKYNKKSCRQKFRLKESDLQTYSCKFWLFDWQYALNNYGDKGMPINSKVSQKSVLFSKDTVSKLPGTSVMILKSESVTCMRGL